MKTQMRGVRSNSQRAWDAIRERHKKGLLICSIDVEYDAKVSYDFAKRYLRQLELSGFVAVASKIEINHICKRNEYRIIKDAGIDAPHFNSDNSLKVETPWRKIVWNTINRLYVNSDFNIKELCAHSDQDIANERNVETYVRALYKAGYLFKVNGARKGISLSRYRLKSFMRTGSKAPIVVLNGVLDANTCDVYEFKVKEVRQ